MSFHVFFELFILDSDGKKSTTVSWQCYQYGKQFRAIYYSCLSLPTATTTGTTTAAATTATNKSTTTTVLLI